jgi:hypothetical protein
MNMFNTLSPSHRLSPTPIVIAALLLAGIGLTACGGGGSDSTTTTDTSTSAGTTTSTSTTASSTACVLCNHATSALNSSASVNAIATATWSCSSTLRSLTANGLPDHAVGTFPNNDNPNTISAQNISASLTLTPTATSVVTPRVGAMNKPGVALNGIAVDPGTAGTCSDTGTCQQGGQAVGAWSLESLVETFLKCG